MIPSVISAASARFCGELFEYFHFRFGEVLATRGDQDRAPWVPALAGAGEFLVRQVLDRLPEWVPALGKARLERSLDGLCRPHRYGASAVRRAAANGDRRQVHRRRALHGQACTVKFRAGSENL